MKKYAIGLVCCVIVAASCGVGAQAIHTASQPAPTVMQVGQTAPKPVPKPAPPPPPAPQTTTTASEPTTTAAPQAQYCALDLPNHGWWTYYSDGTSTLGCAPGVPNRSYGPTSGPVGQPTPQQQQQADHADQQAQKCADAQAQGRDSNACYTP